MKRVPSIGCTCTRLSCRKQLNIALSRFVLLVCTQLDSKGTLLLASTYWHRGPLPCIYTRTARLARLIYCNILSDIGRDERVAGRLRAGPQLSSRHGCQACSRQRSCAVLRARIERWFTLIHPCCASRSPAACSQKLSSHSGLHSNAHAELQLRLTPIAAVYTGCTDWCVYRR